MATMATASQTNASPWNTRIRGLLNRPFTFLRRRLYSGVNHYPLGGTCGATTSSQDPLQQTSVVPVVPAVVVTGPPPQPANEPSGGIVAQPAFTAPTLPSLNCPPASLTVVPTTSTPPPPTAGVVLEPAGTTPGLPENNSTISHSTSGQTLPLPVAEFRPSMSSVGTSNAMTPHLDYHGPALASPSSLAVGAIQRSSVSHDSDPLPGTWSFDEIALVQGLGI